MSNEEIVELEPIDPGSLRSGEGTRVWETVRGRRNRISIARPTLLDPAERLDAETRARLERLHPPGAHALSALLLSLTLLPDSGCRFLSADLILTAQETPEEAVFAHLDPAERSSTVEVTKAKAGLGGSLSDPLGAVVAVEMTPRKQETRLTRTEVALESFGTGTPQAGWRLAVTSSREIPLTTDDLMAVLARPHAHPGTVGVNVVAEIEIRTPGDRWLTWAFKRRDPPSAARTITLQ
ncbi:hypothetical protein [Actinomadura sp. NEAU-AAG7]|uniref:hypothetical protein n=1 Tax=Actinomadura sp. NEAU-AAG7 TaxID=2839640 RepID=UPI001BE4AEC5|nr:hypothetical protein [Actinomadura sp. NEAU-AAG7]MBT2212582.1 hypothetical protein [Actinomadura sp. NEAU-AAG7]